MFHSLSPSSLYVSQSSTPSVPVLLLPCVSQCSTPSVLPLSLLASVPSLSPYPSPPRVSQCSTPSVHCLFLLVLANVPLPQYISFSSPCWLVFHSLSPYPSSACVSVPLPPSPLCVRQCSTPSVHIFLLLVLASVPLPRSLVPPCYPVFHSLLLLFVLANVPHPPSPLCVSQCSTPSFSYLC